MNIEALIASKMEARKAAGLNVLVIFEGRCDFDYYAKDIAARDRFVANMRPRIGTVYDGYVVADVIVR